jgi:hypothetical protein
MLKSTRKCILLVAYFKSTLELITPDIAEQLSAEWSGEDDAVVSKKVQCSSRNESGLIVQIIHYELKPVVICQDHSYVALSASNNVECPQVSAETMSIILRAMYSKQYNNTGSGL